MTELKNSHTLFLEITSFAQVQDNSISNKSKISYDWQKTRSSFQKLWWTYDR